MCAVVDDTSIPWAEKRDLIKQEANEKDEFMIAFNEFGSWFEDDGPKNGDKEGNGEDEDDDEDDEEEDEQEEGKAA
jgi:hypothetical protein